MAAKLSDRMIQPFDGEGDITAWLAKVELVAKLTGIKDVAVLVPLYLEGGRLLISLQAIPATKSRWQLNFRTE